MRTRLIQAGGVLALSAGAVAAWRVPVPTQLTSFALNSPWVFRGEVGVLAALVAVTVLVVFD